MFYSDPRKFISGIILDPDNPNELRDLRLLVHWHRQDFINTITEIIGHNKTHGSKKKTRLNKLYSDLHEKRVRLDDMERALEVAENNNYESIEKKGFYNSALEDAEQDDNIRMEKRLESIVNAGERSNELELLRDIRNRLSELYLYIDKIRSQDNRRNEWQLHGPPNRILQEFKDMMEKLRENAPSDGKDKDKYKEKKP